MNLLILISFIIVCLFSGSHFSDNQGVLSIESNSNNPACPMRTCPSSQTCCGLGKNGYGCCSASANAVCCGDNIHCCPVNTTCDVGWKTCKPGTHQKRMENIAMTQLEVVSVAEVSVKPPPPDACAVCEAVISLVSAVNATNQVNNTRLLLTTLCLLSPPLIQESCKLFISSYYDLIEVGIKKKVAPLQICKTIKVCLPTVNRTNQLSAVTLLNSIIANPLDYNDGQCQACQWVVSAIEAYLAQDATEIELSRVFATLCTVLPGPYSNVCQNFVLVYMSEVVGYVIDNLTPPFICDKLSLCNTRLQQQSAPRMIEKV